MKPSFSARRALTAALMLIGLHACGHKAPTSPGAQPGTQVAGGPGDPNDPNGDGTVVHAAVPRPSAPPPFVSGLFSDHMVLQHTGANVFGWTTANAKVTVAIPELKISVVATADPNTGKWVAKLGPLAVGGPYTVQITGPQSVTFSDVLAGEVWLSSGQSNSVVSLGDIAGLSTAYGSYDASWVSMANAEIANANNTNVRLFFQQNNQSSVYEYTPKAGVWRATSADVVKTFGAAPYLFARQMQQNLQVPVGIIEASLGGTVIRQWVSDVGLAQVGNLQPFTAVQVQDSDLFNGMIAPYEDYKLAGVTWYQGENDCTASPDTLIYGKMLTALLSSWRYWINDAKLPFVVVSLANLGPPQSQPHENDGYAAMDIREAQRRTVMADARAALVVTVDIGDANTVHPPNKWDVGAREALAAMGLVYGSQAESSGPLYASNAIDGNAMTVSFTHTSNGLSVGTKSGVTQTSLSATGTLTSFTVQDAQGNWSDATATISGNTVVVTSKTGAVPVAVCYGWAANPSTNLYNGAGLPASPFCTVAP